MASLARSYGGLGGNRSTVQAHALLSDKTGARLPNMTMRLAMEAMVNYSGYYLKTRRRFRKIR